MTIDLSQYEVGQRFRDKAGRNLILEKTTERFFTTSYHLMVFPNDGEQFICLDAEYDCAGEPFRDYGFLKPIVSAIYRVPARTRRLLKPSPMPTGYQRQWPHLYQMGGGA